MLIESESIQFFLPFRITHYSFKIKRFQGMKYTSMNGSSSLLLRKYNRNVFDPFKTATPDSWQKNNFSVRLIGRKIMWMWDIYLVILKIGSGNRTMFQTQELTVFVDCISHANTYLAVKILQFKSWLENSVLITE